jgi:DNA-binding SARP family transcriptional activator/predicted ATPase
MLTISLLGTLRVATPQGGVKLPTEKANALLAYLALQPNQPHRRERLASLFWGDWDDEAARKQLRQALYLLKKTLDSAQIGLAEQVLDVTHQTVQLHATHCEIDAFQLKTILVQVHQHKHPQLETCSHCHDLLSQVYAFAYAELLTGFNLPDSAEFDDWLGIERVALHQQYQLALEKQTIIQLHQHQFEKAQLSAMRLIALDALYEQAYIHLALAYAYGGKHALALSLAESFQQLLHQQLKTQPSATFRKLIDEIRRGEIASHLPPPAPFPLAIGLPHHLTEPLGRQATIQQGLDLLCDSPTRLVSLLGPGGVGKTTCLYWLAKCITERASGVFSAGVAVLSFEEGGDTAQFWLSLFRALLPAGEQNHNPRAQVLQFLSTRKLLLCIDNAENLPHADQLFHQVLENAPQLKILATSRQAVGLFQEVRLLLAGLPSPAEAHARLDPAQALEEYPALRLFVQQAQKTVAGFRLTAGNLPAVGKICMLTEGMPLALNMAASWVHILSCEKIAQELESGLDLLVFHHTDIPDRHREMRTVFQTFLQFLPESAMLVLSKARIFQRTFSAEALREVCGAGISEIVVLAERFLVLTAESNRYRLHALLHRYLHERFGVSDGELQAKHCDYFSHWAQQFAQQQASLRPEQLQQLEQEQENLVSAVTHALHNRTWQAVALLTESLFLLLDMRSRYKHGEICFRKWLEISHQQNAPSTIMGLLSARLGWFCTHVGKSAESVQLLETATRLSESPHEQAFSRNYLGAVLRLQKQFEPAREWLEQGAELARQHHLEHAESIACNNLGQVAFALQANETALDYYLHSLAIKQKIGDEWGMIFSYLYLGSLARTTDNYDGAVSWLNDALTRSVGFGYRRGEALALQLLGELCIQKNDYPTALQYLNKSLSTFQAIDNQDAAKNIFRLLFSLHGSLVAQSNLTSTS